MASAPAPLSAAIGWWRAATLSQQTINVCPAKIESAQHAQVSDRCGDCGNERFGKGSRWDRPGRAPRSARGRRARDRGDRGGKVGPGRKNHRRRGQARCCKVSRLHVGVGVPPSYRDPATARVDTARELAVRLPVCAKVPGRAPAPAPHVQRPRGKAFSGQGPLAAASRSETRPFSRDARRSPRHWCRDRRPGRRYARTVDFRRFLAICPFGAASRKDVTARGPGLPVQA